MSMLAQPQQPSTSKLDALRLKERLQKNMCPLRLSNNSPKPNLVLEKCQQRGEQETTIEVDEKEEEEDNPLAFKRTRHMRGSLHNLLVVTRPYIEFQGNNNFRPK
jgi:hypothetical protein